MPLRTTEIRDLDGVRAFFDRLAPAYRDCHGPAEALLRYRLAVIARLLEGSERGLLVEIGCGTGLHLFALAHCFERVHGTDLSPAMITEAERVRREHPHAERISLGVAPAHAVASVADETADLVLCVGALEHMLDQARVLREVRRMLKPGGAFVCLTPNGDSAWYAHLAPRLRFTTRHLSTDHYVGAAEFRQLLEDAGLQARILAHWTFVPRGDLPVPLAWLLGLLDRIGRALGIGRLRGGLCCRAVREVASDE